MDKEILERSSGIRLPKKHPIYERVLNNLCRHIETWNGGHQFVKFFTDYGDHILIPRFYPLGSDIEVRDVSSDGYPIDIESNVIPNSERQAKAISEFTNRTSGILQLEPGTGKTVIATCIVSHYKRRSIIIAHKDKLLDQWRDEFVKHTSLTEDDIGRLMGSNFKECFNKSVILTTPHVIAYALSNDKDEFLKALEEANIGVMIVDECHVGVGPEQFSKASLLINAKRTYGLSATPSRADGNDDIIEQHLGEVVYFKPEENELLTPLVYMMKLPFGVYKDNNYFNYGGKFQLSRYYKQMNKANKYNEVVGRWIRQAYKSGRNILIMGTQISPLLELASQANIKKSDVGIFIPGAKDKKYKKIVDTLTDTMDLEEAFHTKRVVFSTYGSCRDGNNRKDLDFLVMYTPCGNVEQAVGRVLRRLDGKAQPIVIDTVDTEGPEVTMYRNNKKVNTNWFVRSAYNRMDIYADKGWEVKYYNVKCKK